MVERTIHGDYIVVWLNAMDSPPRQGATVLEALENFIEYMKARKQTEDEGETYDS